MKALLAFVALFFGVQFVIYAMPAVVVGWIGFAVFVFVIYLLGKAFRA